MTKISTPIEVFCCYSRDDEVYLRKLEIHLSLLQRQGLISFWYDRLIIPGDNWVNAIDTHLETASLILLLVSANFLASDYCYSVEMTRALERQDKGDARVVPILVSPVDWSEAPFAHLQALPTDAKPITTWRPQNRALADIATGIRRVIKDLANGTLPPPLSGDIAAKIREYQNIRNDHAGIVLRAMKLLALAGIKNQTEERIQQVCANMFDDELLRDNRETWQKTIDYLIEREFLTERHHEGSDKLSLAIHQDTYFDKVIIDYPVPKQPHQLERDVKRLLEVFVVLKDAEFLVELCTGLLVATDFKEIALAAADYAFSFQGDSASLRHIRATILYKLERYEDALAALSDFP
jgi:hypothetical protein